MMKNYKETLLGKGRKLFSLLLCALTVSACNDDDCINGGTDNNNLQVEVSASLHSRAPIYDSALPDNNPIGVTLTATDGSSYDKQNYTNIPYYGITADGKQTWQPQDKPVTLSVTEGVAMAYWPYNQNAADMTAVPVETSTQTDYMYSGNVTGLTNATPKAAFQMKHAMALVRVNVVRGTYTAAGTVTAVTAASEAFCTSGTMNVSTGALADLVGAETPFIEEPAGTVITTSGRMTEFLVLPDVDVDAASVTLGVTVDSRKYNTAVEVTEAFKQGYIYTYNLTLDNTALNMSGVTVTPWQEGNSLDSSLTMTYNEDEYVVNILIENNNSVYIHNVADLIGTINWGDGTVDTYTTKTTNPEHIYNVSGTYTVTVKGTCPWLYGYWNGYGIATPYIIDILHIGSQMGITSLAGAFSHTKLTKIPEGIFDGLTEVTTFDGTFSGCEGITEIPKGLFDKNTKVTDFSMTFWGCTGLTSIPEGLFDNCTEVTDFGNTFDWCDGITDIPVKLFDKNTKVTYFYKTFRGCTGLTSIPNALFDKCTEVMTFWQTFESCTGLTSIPTGLFDNNIKVTDFRDVFKGCAGLTGESPYTTINVDGNDVKVHLYERSSYPDYFTAPTRYSSAFASCTGLTDYAEITIAGWN